MKKGQEVIVTDDSGSIFKNGDIVTFVEDVSHNYSSGRKFYDFMNESGLIQTLEPYEFEIIIDGVATVTIPKTKKSFEQYDKENPEIWEKFKEFAFKAIKKGFKHYGAKSIFEIIRWNTKTSGNDGLKVNNNYTSGYSRKFMNEFPEHEGFFRTRNSG